MKILMTTSEFPPVVGGVASHVDELSKAIQSLGHKVTVVARLSRGGAAREVNEQGVEIHRVALPGNRLLYDLALGRYLKKLHRHQQFDLVHVHGMRPLVASHKLRIPLAFTNHTSGFLKRLGASDSKQASTLKRINFADTILAPSEELVEATRTMGYQKTCRYIPNAIDVEKFSPDNSELRQRLNIPEDAFVVVLARRLAEKNGVLYFARAAAQIDNPNCHFVIAGDGAERAEFEAILKRGKSWQRTHMLGAVDNTQMPAVFRAGDVSVLPSLMEATSIAGLEAMGCGLPLIGTRVGGIPAIIEDGVSGYLVPPRDPAALTEKMNELANKPDLAKQMGRASRNRVCKIFSWPIVAQQTLCALEEILPETAPR